MAKNGEFELKDAWLYSVRRNVLVVIKGAVQLPKNFESKPYHPHWDRVNFKVDPEEKTLQRYYSVQREEGVVRSNSLWLSERDDDKALDLFIEDKKDRIRQYEARIANIKRDIEILEKTR